MVCDTAGPGARWCPAAVTVASSVKRPVGLSSSVSSSIESARLPSVSISSNALSAFAAARLESNGVRQLERHRWRL